MCVYEYVYAVYCHVFCNAARERLERHPACSGTDAGVFHGDGYATKSGSGVKYTLRHCIVTSVVVSFRRGFCVE